MRLFGFLSAGLVFGIVLTKAEVISWFRIIEMFRFESFHMYGVIGTAVVVGIGIIWLMKRFKIKTIDQEQVAYSFKLPLSPRRHLLAGTIFGLGWALVGACPGPIYALLGQGYTVFALVLLSATLGAFSYGAIKDKLPH